MWQKAPSSIPAVTNIMFYVWASDTGTGTGTGNGRTGAPCSISVPDLLHLRQLVGCYGKTAVERDHGVPHTIASNMTTRQLRSHPFTPIHSNSTTPCPKLGGPTLVKVCVFHYIGLGICGTHAPPGTRRFGAISSPHLD